MHRLTAYRNYLREEEPAAMQAALEALTETQVQELAHELIELDKAWSQLEGEPNAGFLESSRTFTGDYQFLADFEQYDLDKLRRLLIFYPKIDVTLRTYGDHEYGYLGNLGRTGLGFELRVLLELQPLIDSDLINIIPYPRAEKLARRYAATDLDEAEDYQWQTGIDRGDLALMTTLRNYNAFGKKPLSIGLLDMDEDAIETHQYFLPINNVNIDLAVIGETGSEIICTHPAMHDYLSLKLKRSAAKLHIPDMWVAPLFEDSLVDLSALDLNDVIQLHLGEEAFAQWRDNYSRALRMLRSEARHSAINDATARAIIREQLADSAEIMRERVRKSSFLSHLSDASVSFALSGAAAAMVDPAMSTAIATGATTAALTVAYKAIFARSSPSDHAALKLYSTLCKRTNY